MLLTKINKVKNNQIVFDILRLFINHKIFFFIVIRCKTILIFSLI